MTEKNEMHEQNLDEAVSPEIKKSSFLKTRTGTITFALVGGIAIGAMFFSMPDADASEEKVTEPTTQAMSTTQTVEDPMGAPLTESMMGQTDENGTRYSTDGGVTWTEGTPPGATVTETPEGENGMVTSSQGTPPPTGSDVEGGTLVKTSPDGTSEYSTDGGQTWNEGLPPGAETVTNPDGSLGVVCR